MNDHPIASRLALAVVALCCLVAFVLRLPALGRPSLSSAEQRVLAESQGLDPSEPLPEDAPVSPDALSRREGLGSIARAARSSPLYTTALASWSRKAGASEEALRRPSAVGGVATVAVVATIAALLAGPWAAGAAGLLTALSPIHMLASREAGPGAAAVLLLASALWLTLRTDLDGSPSRAIVLGGLLGLCALGPPPLIALALLQLAWLAGSSRHRREWGIAAGVAALVVGLAWGGGLLRPPLEDGASLGWVPETTLLGVVRCAGASFTRVAGLEYHLVVPHARHVAPLTLLVVAVALRGASRLDLRRRWLLLGGAGLPFALGAVLALWSGSVAPLQSHRLLPALPFLMVLTGVGLASLNRWPGWIARGLVVCATAVFVALALAAPPRETSPRQSLARTIGGCRAPEAVVSVQRPLDVFALAAWRLPGPLWLRSSAGPPPPDPSVRIEPSSTCVAGIPSHCPAFPRCPPHDARHTTVAGASSSGTRSQRTR